MSFFKPAVRSVESEIRRNQSIIMSSGLAVILFGAWGIINIFMYKYLDPKGLTELLGMVEGEMPQELYETIVFNIILIVLIINFLIRMYIGFAAINEGRGVRTGRWLYLVLSVCIIFFTVYSDVDTIVKAILEPAQDNNTYHIITAIVNLSMAVAFWEILLSSARLRKLRKYGKMI